MRLTYKEAKSIVEQTHKTFGDEAKVYLFGSRVDVTKKGGDIDLFIKPDFRRDNSPEDEIAFLCGLKELIGEQKIDLVVAKDSSRKIEIVALEEGIELNLENLKIEKTLSECDKHLLRINDAYQDMLEFMPLTAEKYLHLVKDEVQDVDQYLYRFSKLHDAMGQKLFKLILAKFEDRQEPLTFIDALNKIEKLGIIHSASDWRVLRELRNALSHDYDDEPEQMSALINIIFSKKELIETIYNRAKVVAKT